MNQLTRLFLSLVVPAAVLFAWGAWGDPSSPIAPPPQTWLQSGEAMLAAGELQSSVIATLKTVLFSIFLASLIGATLGAVLGSRPALAAAVAPTLEFLRSLPPPTIVPVAMLLIASGTVLELTVVSLAALWPVLLNVLQAMRAIHPTLVNAGRTLRISALSKAVNIYVPCLLPGLTTGLRVATPLAIIVALLVEMLATRPGIGRMLLTAQRDFDAPAVFALLLTVSFIGVCVNVAFELLERALSKTLPHALR